MSHSWDGFMSNSENKSDLARFLSQEVTAHAPQNNTVVVAGGFEDIAEVYSNDPGIDTEH